MAGSYKNSTVSKVDNTLVSQSIPQAYSDISSGLVIETGQPEPFPDNNSFGESSKGASELTSYEGESSQITEGTQKASTHLAVPTIEDVIDDDLSTLQPDTVISSVVKPVKENKEANISETNGRRSRTIPRSPSIPSIEAPISSPEFAANEAVGFDLPEYLDVIESDNAEPADLRPNSIKDSSHSRPGRRRRRIHTRMPTTTSSESEDNAEDFLQSSHIVHNNQNPSFNDDYQRQTMQPNTRSTPYGPSGPVPRPAVTHHSHNGMNQPATNTSASSYGYPPVPHYGAPLQAGMPSVYGSQPHGYYGSQYPYYPAYGYPPPPPLPLPPPNYPPGVLGGTPAASNTSEKPQVAPEVNDDDMFKRFEALLMAQQAERDRAEHERREQVRSAEDQVMALRRAEQERKDEEARIRQEAIREAREQAEAAAKARAERAAEEARIRAEAAAATRTAMAAEATALAERDARDARIREEALQQLSEASKQHDMIRFVDTRKQTFVFPLSEVGKWEGMMKLVRATLHSDAGIPLQDAILILDADGNQILPSLWSKIVKPGATYSIRMSSGAKDSRSARGRQELGGLTSPDKEDILSDKHDEYTYLKGTVSSKSTSADPNLRDVFDDFSKQLQHVIRIEQDRSRREVRQDLLKHISEIAMLSDQQSNHYGTSVVNKSNVSSLRGKSEALDTPELYYNNTLSVNGPTGQTALRRRWRSDSDSVDLTHADASSNAKATGREHIPNTTVGETDAIQNQIIQLETLLATREREEALLLANSQLVISKQRLQALETRLQALESNSLSSRMSSSSRTRATTTADTGASERAMQSSHSESVLSQVDQTLPTDTKRGSGSSWRALGRKLTRGADGSPIATSIRPRSRR